MKRKIDKKTALTISVLVVVGMFVAIALTTIVSAVPIWNNGASGTESYYIAIDSNNDESDQAFGVFTDGTPGSGPEIELFRVQEDGKVGIGTTGPDAKLDILKSSAGAQLRLTETDGSVYTDFETTSSTGYLWINPSGDRVAIGSGPGSPTPACTLYIQTSDAATNTVSYGQRITHLTSGTPAANFGTGIVFELLDDSEADVDSAGAIEAIWSTATAGSEASSLLFKTNSAGATDLETKMLIDKDGYVGIGTTSPSNLLSVYGATPVVDIETSDSTVIDGDNLGTIQFRGLDATLEHLVGAMIRAEAVDTWDGDDVDNAPTELQFFTEDNTGYDHLDTPRMVISQNGDVGIGTGFTTSGARLDIQDSGTAKSNLDIFEITNTAFASDMDGTETSIYFNQAYYIDLDVGGVVDAGRITVGTETDWRTTASTQDGYMAFHTVLDGTVSEKMRITSDGNVGIGTIGPNYPLQVDGGISGIEKSSDPTEPSEGEFVIWMSNGGGKGSDGDVLIASKAAGNTNWAILFDHSAGTAW